MPSPDGNPHVKKKCDKGVNETGGEKGCLVTSSAKVSISPLFFSVQIVHKAVRATIVVYE